MSIWEVLGIAPTTDKAAIRHAYAQKTRTCHPEEDPEGFDALHKAFTAAMRAARQGVSMAVMEQESPAAPAAPAVSPQQNSAEARRAAAKAARAARRAAEQQAVEQYASRAQRRAGKIIQLGQGEQEEGQQFDFAAVDAAPAQAAPEQKTEPDRPLTHEEQAWRNGPAPAPAPEPQEQSKQPERQPVYRQPSPEYQPVETVSRPRSGKGWRVASLVLAAGVLLQLVRGGFVSATLLLIALCWCSMQGARVDWTQPRPRRRIMGLWGVGVVLLPVLWFFVMTVTWGLHGAQDAALDYAVGSIFLSTLAAPFGLCSTLVARQRANRL